MQTYIWKLTLAGVSRNKSPLLLWHGIRTAFPICHTGRLSRLHHFWLHIRETKCVVSRGRGRCTDMCNTDTWSNVPKRSLCLLTNGKGALVATLGWLLQLEMVWLLMTCIQHVILVFSAALEKRQWTELLAFSLCLGTSSLMPRSGLSSTSSADHFHLTAVGFQTVRSGVCNVNFCCGI